VGHAVRVLMGWEGIWWVVGAGVNGGDEVLGEGKRRQRIRDGGGCLILIVQNITGEYIASYGK